MRTGAWIGLVVVLVGWKTRATGQFALHTIEGNDLFVVERTASQWRLVRFSLSHPRAGGAARGWGIVTSWIATDGTALYAVQGRDIVALSL